MTQATTSTSFNSVLTIQLLKTSHKVHEDFRDFIAKRLSSALRPIANGLKNVTVRLSDINGPKGGRDKHCSITVDTLNGQRMVVRHVDAGRHRAAAMAIRRIAESIRREHKRHLQRQTAKLHHRRNLRRQTREMAAFE